MLHRIIVERVTQWVVRHDYLETILDPLVAESLRQFEEEKQLNRTIDFRIPIEFSVGAFRFGHSMVRDVYKTGVNDLHNKEVKVDCAFGTDRFPGRRCSGIAG
jgi:hypothetical protein